MKLILLLLALAGIAVLTNPNLVGLEPAEPDEPATARAESRPTRDQLLEAEAARIQTRPPMNLELPAVTDTQRRSSLEPVISAERVAEIDARSKEALRQLEDRAEALREDSARREKRARRYR